MKILAVTGITGHTGKFFLQELINHKFDGTLRCLIRETSNTVALDNSGLNIEKVVGNISSEDSLHELLHGADTVMHISNIHQSVSLINIAIIEGVKRAVLVHTTGIYSKHKMASYEYMEIESRLNEIIKNNIIDVTILRPTMIFGDMCDHNIHKFIKMVDMLPVMIEINHGSGKLRPVNARDLGKAYYQVINLEQLPELGYTLSGERSISMHELFLLIGQYLGKKVHFINCPMWLATFITKCIKVISFSKVNLVEKVLRMGEDRDYPHDTATRDFGYCPELFNEGLRREINEYLEYNKGL